MNELYKTFYGSELYGTKLPTSDCDIVSVNVPSIDSVLLGKPGIESSQAINNDSDTSRHSLLAFINGLKTGNATMLEIFFSSFEHNSTIYMNDMWLELVNARLRVVSKRCDSLIGYCRAQAKMYDLRGDRLAAVQDAIAVFKSLISIASSSRLGDHINRSLISDLVSRHPGNILVRDIDIGNGKTLTHLEVSGKAIPSTFTLMAGMEILIRREAEYGERVKAATETKNIDWKGMMHAIRISEQTLEYLRTGFITFPRPNALYLKDIRLGNIDYKKVAGDIQQNLLDIEAERAITKLPDAPDEDFIDKWAVKVYRTLDGDIHA